MVFKVFFGHAAFRALVGFAVEVMATGSRFAAHL